jgi:hypothetical protein
MSQKNRIHEHLKISPITPLEALRQYKCMRLASRVNELRRLGIDIKTEMIRNGTKRYAKYYL